VILGNSKNFKGTGYVCFIDVLGFSNDILANWQSLTSNPLEKILSIKGEMPGFAEVEEDDHRESHRTYVCRVSMISDSVTICFGFSGGIVIGDLVLGLEAVLANISYVWSTSIDNGYTVRGAIDFGDIYWNEGDLIGPAFINAYQLEREAARNSRIIVSSNLNKVLKNLVSRYKGPLTDHLMQHFRKDIDGYIIVDPTILCQSEAERDSLIHSLKTMRDTVPSAIIREKYNPLIGMLSDRAKADLKDEDVGTY
jgi:hypothetical protein